ncbi:hypothetical protein [Culicoidibacter larvae]|uniref:DUF5050 domain-containing protein n=1 Tax=Culicoidibacter larvae TaxID=2579976 RepID=A0A5R8QB00_9FIRM|nr:hypothetical protein [Culicoidibacter larvae]TLG72498.1 hypothetical protein FEZ08_08910 [Culicoidibacter larvae]
MGHSLSYQTVVLPSVEADVSQSPNIFDTLWQDKKSSRFNPGEWSAIAEVPIDNAGNLLLGLMGEEKAELKLYNVMSQQERIIDSISNEYYYAYAGSDDRYMVYYTYKTMQSIAVPVTYKIIDLESFNVITADISSISINTDTVYIDTRVSLHEDKMYFEVNCREPKVNGNKVEDYGISIYSFDLQSENFAEVMIDAASPSATAEGIYYLQAANDGSATLFLQDWSGKTIQYFNNVIQYSVYDQAIIWIEAVENSSIQRNMNFFQNGINKVLYTSDNFYFWDVRYNGTYVTWQQSSAPLYIYDIASESFYQVSDKSGARYAIASENYLYWFEITRQGEIKDDVDTEIVFVAL